MFSYFQIVFILDLNRNALKTACEELDIAPLNDTDYEFLEEYKSCLSVIADGVKLLEGNKQPFSVF